jgi:hypothetical protein
MVDRRLAYASTPCGTAGAAPKTSVSRVRRTDELPKCDFVHIDASPGDEATGDGSADACTAGSAGRDPMPLFGQPTCNPNAIAITDEYGFRYNCRGDLLR